MAHDGLDPIKKPGMLLKRKASLVFFCNLHILLSAKLFLSD